MVTKIETNWESKIEAELVRRKEEKFSREHTRPSKSINIKKKYDEEEGNASTNWGIVGDL
jgi:hypothetical protein